MNLTDLSLRLAARVFSRVIVRGEPGAVYLTFDDGPDPEITPRVLDILKEYDARATFFVTGSQVDRHPEIVRRIAAEGHTLGSHGYEHRSLIFARYRLIKEDLQKSIAVIRRALAAPPFHPSPQSGGGRIHIPPQPGGGDDPIRRTGGDAQGVGRDGPESDAGQDCPAYPRQSDAGQDCPTYYRPPYGRIGFGMVKAARELDLTVVLWSRLVGDWRPFDRGALFRRATEGLEPGEIIVLHDRGRYAAQMAESLPEIVAVLKGRFKLRGL